MDYKSATRLGFWECLIHKVIDTLPPVQVQVRCVSGRSILPNHCTSLQPLTNHFLITHNRDQVDYRSFERETLVSGAEQVQGIGCGVAEDDLYEGIKMQ